MLYVIHV